MRMFFVAGIGVAVFIEILLASKKNKSSADRILTLWMLLVVVHLSLLYLYVTEDIYRFPFLLGIEQPLPMFHGIFLYLYAATLTNQLPANRAFLVLHAVPAIVMYAYLATFYSLPAEQKIQVYLNHGAGHELFNTLRWYAIAVSGVSYVTWVAFLLRRHRAKVRDQFSNLATVNLRWLQVLTYGLGGVWLLVILFRNDILTLGGMVTFVFLIGFFGVRQADIFTPNQSPAEGEDQKKKYPKSGLTEEASGELHQELQRLMKEEALYKKTDLSINDLSSRLGVHPNYLSQVINQKEKKNFYDFVNTYRLEEFKRLIAHSRHQQFTLLSLAHDCGFSSKSSFNRYFKRATGLTPSEYTAAPAGDQRSPA